MSKRGRNDYSYSPSSSSSSSSSSSVRSERQGNSRSKKKIKLDHLSFEEEEDALTIQSELNKAMGNLLGPALRTFLDDEDVVPFSSKIDVAFYLNEMKRELMNGANFLPFSDEEKTFLQVAIDGRNAIAHFNLGLILANWRRYVNAFKKVCYWIGKPRSSSRLEDLKSVISESIYED